mgnify:CR=1 FL=1
MFHHLVLDENNLKAGIQEIRPIDAAKIKKVKQVKKKKDPETGATLIESVDEFYIYQEKAGSTNQGIKITPDSVSYVTSGLLDEARKKVVSHLHKALKPINQLRMMEDSLVIYRLARAPERRIFYIDVGNLPKGNLFFGNKFIGTNEFLSEPGGPGDYCNSVSGPFFHEDFESGLRISRELLEKIDITLIFNGTV